MGCPSRSGPSISGAGLFYGHPRQLLIQAGAAGTVIVWDGFVTFAILWVISRFTKLRMSDEEQLMGDLAVHGEVAYPEEEQELALAGMSISGAGDGSKIHSEDDPLGPGKVLTE